MKVALQSSLHYCIVRGVSLSWRSLYSGVWSQYPLQPQELHHYPPGLHWRGLENMSRRHNHLTSIICMTSNLPLITSNSMIGNSSTSIITSIEPFFCFRTKCEVSSICSCQHCQPIITAPTGRYQSYSRPGLCWKAPRCG